MMNRLVLAVFAVSFLSLVPAPEVVSQPVGSGESFSAAGEFTVTGKELIERLTRLEEGQKALRDEMERGQKALNQRMDDLDKRVNQRIDGLAQRIDDLRNLMYVLLGGMIALIGFVIWDRRSAISPVITRTRELEEREELTLRVLREYARKEPKMADVLKSLGLL